MSNWKYLNLLRVRKENLYGINPIYATEASDGFNGMFRIPINEAVIRCIASDDAQAPPGDDRWAWQHVSVSIERDMRPPKWDIMCQVKDLFFEPEDWVVQFHPAKSEYVNHHPGCLHLWRPLKATLPTPLRIMVGPWNGRTA